MSGDPLRFVSRITGSQLAALRKRGAITGKDMAASIGVTPTFLSQAERDRRPVMDRIGWAVFLQGELGRHVSRRGDVLHAIERVDGCTLELDGVDVTAAFLADKREELAILERLIAATRRDWKAVLGTHECDPLEVGPDVPDEQVDWLDPLCRPELKPL